MHRNHGDSSKSWGHGSRSCTISGMAPRHTVDLINSYFHLAILCKLSKQERAPFNISIMDNLLFQNECANRTQQSRLKKSIRGPIAKSQWGSRDKGARTCEKSEDQSIHIQYDNPVTGCCMLEDSRSGKGRAVSTFARY